MKKIKLIFQLINSKEKKKLSFIILLMIFAAFLETVGIGLIIPAISILINGTDGFLNIKIFESFKQIISNFSDKELALYLFVALFLIFFIKSIFLAILYHIQYKFSSSVLERISKEIYSKIVMQPYSLFFQKNSSKYLNTLTNESKIFIDSCLEPFLLVSAELIIFFFILVFLIIIEPIGSLLVIFTLSSAMIIFYFFTKNKTRHWGLQRQIYEEKLLKNMQETFHGIKEIKIFNVTKFIFSIFIQNLFKTVEARRKMNFILQLPRMWLEIIAVFTMVAVVVVSLIFSNDISGVIPILAVFSAAAFRIIPSANRILIATQNLRYGFASAEKLIENIRDIDDSYKGYDATSKNFDVKNFEKLEMKNISFNYESPNKKIFNNLNFSLKKGECIGIVGTTGIGKSTFVDIFCGLLKQKNGDLFINQKKVNNFDINWNNLIGYVPQNYYLIDGSMKENIAFGQIENEINLKKLHKSIEVSQLNDLVNSLELGINTKIGERGIKFSGGQKQRLAIARALYFEPEIIIFDESTSALDNETEKKLMETITKLIGTKTIIIISHRLSTLQNCNKVFRIENQTLKQIDI
jgi:ABC-type multidrug transport system fused ATPase/permease subunit